MTTEEAVTPGRLEEEPNQRKYERCLGTREFWSPEEPACSVTGRSQLSEGRKAPGLWQQLSLQKQYRLLSFLPAETILRTDL